AVGAGRGTDVSGRPLRRRACLGRRSAWRGAPAYALARAGPGVPDRCAADGPHALSPFALVRHRGPQHRHGA
ncbi:hypothetical protein KDA82_10870, partial [Streptomyces daliensis]|nr:hypothetical protein [Streptomyces daliensis]